MLPIKRSSTDNKRILILALLGFGWAAHTSAQSPNLTTIGALPSSLEETSGLEYNSPNSLWTHNDSGGEPKIYEIDTLGALQRTVVLRGATNVDWEDIAQDAQGRFYIGDIGNNDNNRTNLRIYRIPNPSTLASDTADVEVIRYTYEDQAAFPPADSLKQFDMEAMFVWQDSIYLFSKNRTNPHDGICKYYSLPADTGTHIARLRGSFNLGSGSQQETWITAADISPDGEHVVLLSGRYFWVFSCFPGTQFLQGAQARITHSNLTQKEGIVVAPSGRAYVTDERFAGVIGGNLYRANLNPWLWEPAVWLGNDTTFTGDSLVLDAGNPGASYAWSDGSTQQTLTAYQSGIFAITVTAPNGCTAADTIEVDILVGENESHQPITFSVYPQPASDHIIIEGPFSASAHYKIMALDGKCLIEGQWEGERREISIEKLPAGIFALHIWDGQNRATCKIWVEK